MSGHGGFGTIGSYSPQININQPLGGGEEIQRSNSVGGVRPGGVQPNVVPQNVVPQAQPPQEPARAHTSGTRRRPTSRSSGTRQACFRKCRSTRRSSS